MILLDTNVVIAFFNGNKAVLKRIQTEIDRIALSTFVIAELDYGAKASQKAKANLEKLYRFVDIVQVIPFDLECAKVFGTIKSMFILEQPKNLNAMDLRHARYDREWTIQKKPSKS